MASYVHYCASLIGAKPLIPKKTLNEIRYAATGHYQKIDKGLELVMIPHFLHTFCTKTFLINWKISSITVCLL